MTDPLAKLITLNRRRFLQATAASSASLLMPGFLQGCGSSQGVPPLEVDPNSPWWLQHNFAPVFDELDEGNLSVRGAIPPELDGLYVRNGSNPQASDNTHWFLGDGMVHQVRIQNGSASYKNRYIRTDAYEQNLTALELGLPEGGNHNANVSLIQHAGRLLASGEVGAPYELDENQLTTLGVHDFGGALDTSFTAHSKIDPETGILHFFGYGLLAQPYITYCVADADGTLIKCEGIEGSGPTMMHSFAITDQHAIFYEQPVLFDLAALGTTGWPFRWSDEFVPRVGVMPLGGNADQVRWAEIPPSYVFHEHNAYRDGDDIVLHVCRYPRMMDGERFGSFQPRLHRWRIGTSGAELSFSEEQISERTLEFPMHDKRHTGRATRHAWFIQTRDHADTLDLGGIVHLDTQTGQMREWDPGDHRQAGEAFFVGAASGEGEGWLLSMVYDRADDASDLVILAADDVSAGPVAEIRMPRRVPHGFHGLWLAE